ncbi:hypothetical protein [Limoniibacter endophyticus]|uniref:Uncharacterized protein n=1 Tax=Limoniibacter endophyticus TaxID=1565040 RepID=A0A8J3DP90_9HYPH|nr:hypothetical protein [Limoniibacter endophyticus]GHC70398.1 hypothetical protein GCM10010136_16640 [Limoniibacter endophyticus]
MADALEANKTAIGIAETAKVVGNLAGPAVGAVEGYQAVLEDASAAAKMAGAVNGALKQIDNTMISSVVFGVTTLGASPAAGPSLGVVPVAVGVLAASAANATYSASPAERYVDAVIDAITPGIEKGISLAIQVHDIHGAMLNKGLSTLGEVFE